MEMLLEEPVTTTRFLVSCTDCHGFFSLRVEPLVCPTCRCPRIHCAELSDQPQPQEISC
jgi:Zn finger protein HypA/HybF involved in hydrogenase expression